MKWDDGIKETQDLIKTTKNVQIVHIETKSPLNFKNRDFIEKRIFFKENGTYYIYLTFIPDEVILQTNYI